MDHKNKKIFICATEQSGDNIGKNILENLFYDFPYLIVDGVGGSKMKPFMKNQFYTIKDFKSIGIVEVLFSIKKYLSMINILSKFIILNKYEIIITIDSPDFNYPLAKKIRKRGYKGKLIQVVAPTVWAWREYRAKKFACIYNKMLTLFSFENKYFEKFNLSTVCIGHPIYHINNYLNKSQVKDFIAFLPGSRLGEINSLFIYFNLAQDHLLELNSKLKIFIPTLPHLKNEILKRTKNWKITTEISIDDKEIEKYFTRTKIALVCSGTASLEISKRLIPQLIIYKLNLLTEIIAKFFVKVKFANIINILENKMIIQEITNSNLRKKIFLEKFNDLVLNINKVNDKQIIKINKLIKNIELSNSPYKIAANEIKKLL